MKHSEAVKTLGMLRHALGTTSPKIKALAYKTICRPKLEYASVVWDPYMQNSKDLLESLQNKAVVVTICAVYCLS